MSAFIVERYLIARRIWKIRDQQAHEGFTDKRTGLAVPPQSWSAWFEWAFGMPLDEYAALAKDGKHAELVDKLTSVRAEYLIAGHWYTAIGNPEDTFETLAAALRRDFVQVEDVRARE